MVTVCLCQTQLVLRMLVLHPALTPGRTQMLRVVTFGQIPMVQAAMVVRMRVEEMVFRTLLRSLVEGMVYRRFLQSVVLLEIDRTCLAVVSDSAAHRMGWMMLVDFDPRPRMLMAARTHLLFGHWLNHRRAMADLVGQMQESVQACQTDSIVRGSRVAQTQTLSVPVLTLGRMPNQSVRSAKVDQMQMALRQAVREGSAGRTQMADRKDCHHRQAKKAFRNRQPEMIRRTESKLVQTLVDRVLVAKRLHRERKAARSRDLQMARSRMDLVVAGHYLHQRR